ncbi:MAG TPA: hypothetical protein VFL60_09715 [Gaiellaceae bacterium]|nr:hypothetical protein [Gaiellaceae bacterium]
MTTAELTLPAPAQPGRTTRIAAIAAAVTALVLALAGAAALAGNVLRDRDGYFDTPTETFTSGGHAIAMKSVDISDAPQWALDAGLSSVRVEAHGDHRLFVGIARAADLERYLRGTAHDDVAGLSYRPFRLDYDHVGGGAPARAPGKEPFWAEWVAGTGRVVLDWKPRPGDWRAVVMNADGSRGVAAELRFGARSSLLWWVGAALLGAAVLAAAAAAALRSRARAAR